MANVLVIAESADKTIKRTTYSAIRFAQSLAKDTGGSFSILVLGAGVGDAAKDLAAYGAAKVLVADDAGLAQYVCERYSPTVLATVQQSFDVVVATASTFGKDLLPRVAAALDAGYANDISSVKVDGGKIRYKRPMYAGNAYGWCEIVSAVQVVSVRQSEFAPAESVGGTSPIEKIGAAPPAAAAARVEFVSLAQAKNERPELAEASVVVSGGRALKEKFKEVIEPLADLFGAAIGATRAIRGRAPSRG